jgi:hypothetical protein
VRTSIDEEMDRFWVHGIPTLALFPFPTLEQNVSSTIFKNPFKRDQKSIADVVFRQSFRLMERTRRLSSNLKLRSFDRRCMKTFAQQVSRQQGGVV